MSDVEIKVGEELIRKNYVEVVQRFKNGAIKKIYKIAVEEVQNPDDAKYFEDIGRKLLGMNKDLADTASTVRKIGRDLNKISKDFKDIPGIIEKLALSTTKLNWVTIGISAMNLAVTSGGFAVVNEKLNTLAKEIGSMRETLDRMAKKSDIDIREHFNSVRIEYIRMLDAEKCGAEYPYKDLENLTIKMAETLNYLYMCFAEDASGEPKIILNAIFTLLPMFVNVINKFDTKYYYQHHTTIQAGKKFHDLHDEWMALFAELRSQKFLDKVQDVCILNEDMCSREASDTVLATYYMTVASEVGVKDNQIILQSFENENAYRRFKGELVDEAINEYKAELDDETVALLNPEFSKLQAQKHLLA